MSNNYPPGVSESTYGAPWNDQNYYVTFCFEQELDLVTFYSDELELAFSLNGPLKYTEEELHKAALDVIKDEYCILLTNYPEIEINIYSIDDE